MDDDNVWGPPGSARLRDFLSLDRRIDRSWRRGWGTVGVFVDVQNLTSEANPEGVYFEDGVPHMMNGLPLLPLIGVSYLPPE